MENKYINEEVEREIKRVIRLALEAEEFGFKTCRMEKPGEVAVVFYRRWRLQSDLQ